VDFRRGSRRRRLSHYVPVGQRKPRTSRGFFFSPLLQSTACAGHKSTDKKNRLRFGGDGCLPYTGAVDELLGEEDRASPAGLLLLALRCFRGDRGRRGWRRRRRRWCLTGSPLLPLERGRQCVDSFPHRAQAPFAQVLEDEGILASELDLDGVLGVRGHVVGEVRDPVASAAFHRCNVLPCHFSLHDRPQKRPG